MALRTRHMKMHERLSLHTKRLPPLRVGDHVRVQNQTGRFPLKWDKTGIVVEVRQFDQYVVKIDGSNNSTIRNRKFLRKFIPLFNTPSPRPIFEDMRLPPGHTHQSTTSPPSLQINPEVSSNQSPVEPDTRPPLIPNLPTVPQSPLPNPAPTDGASPPSDPGPSTSVPPAQPPALRRSTRTRQPPKWLTDNYVRGVQAYH